MTTTKVNIGLALSRNFNKVTLELLDEPIEHDGEDGLKAGIQYRYDIILREIDKVFKGMDYGKDKA